MTQVSKAKKVLVIALASLFVLGGCATTAVDPNYAAQLASHDAQTKATLQLAQAKASADAVRWTAIAEIAKTGDASTKSAALMALAFAGGSGGSNGDAVALALARNVPQAPESDADKAYKWTALFAGPVTNMASAYFGFKLGTTQSNNAASVALSTNSTFAGMFNSSAASNTAIANGGFNAVTGTATAGFGSMNTLATQLAQPTPPSIYVTGNGNSFSQASGGNAANTGTYNTRNCVTGNAGNGASGGGGGSASGSSGASGGQGGAAGPNNC